MTSAPSMGDAPFHCPPGNIMLDLPAPPSTNRIWMRAKAGKRAVFTSPEYKSWKRRADDLIGAMAQLRGVKPIRGAFEIEITLSEKHTKVDLDNSAKALLDYCVRCSLVTDDAPKYLRKLIMGWGEAPHGCRLILRPVAA